MEQRNPPPYAKLLNPHHTRSMKKSDIITAWNRQKQMENLVRLLFVLGILFSVLAVILAYNLNK